MKLKIKHSCGHTWNYDIEAGKPSDCATWERKMKKQNCPSCCHPPPLPEQAEKHVPMWFRFIPDVPQDVQDEFLRCLRQRISVKMAKYLRAKSSNPVIARTVYLQLHADAEPLTFKQMVLDNSPLVEEADVHYSLRKVRRHAGS